MHRIAALVAGVLCLPAVPVAAQGIRSLTGSEWLAEPAQRAPGGAPVPSRGESPALMENMLLLRATVKQLSESLAMANAEAETFKRQAADLSLRLDTLGLAELENNPASLEQKLLTAVREARSQQKRATDLENSLVDLTEAVVTLLQQTEGISPQVRMDVEARLRKANEMLGALPPGVEEASAVEADLTNALVVDLKPDLSLLVANVGSANGVRIGAPFRIIRANQIIGTAVAVDVRDRISGLIVQTLENEQIPAGKGDRLRIITRQ